MTEDDGALDAKYLAQPVTRLDLWRALSAVRKMTLALQVQALSLTTQDFGKAREASADLAEIGKEIDQVLENLLRAPKGDQE